MHKYNYLRAFEITVGGFRYEEKNSILVTCRIDDGFPVGRMRK